jgi:hypothetical protein
MHWKRQPADCYERSVFSGQSNSLSALSDDPSPPDKPFVLVIASDTSSISGPDLVARAAALIRSGARYVCCWGPDCARLHDCFDEAAGELSGWDASGDWHVMTTWHDNERLEDVLWFALNAAIPTPDEAAATTRTVLAVSIANDNWAATMDDYLAAGAPMPNEA